MALEVIGTGGVLQRERLEGAALLTAFVEGRMQQFLRSRFERPSLDAWEADWSVLRHGLFDAMPDGINPSAGV